MFTLHINQPSRLVIKPFLSSSQSSENNSTGDIIKTLESGSILMLEPIQRNSEKWFGANCYHNGSSFPISKKPLFGPFSEISFNLFNFSFLNRFENQNLDEQSYENDRFTCNGQSSQINGDESDDLSLGSDGGTTDVSEFTSDEEIIGKKRTTSVNKDERPKKKKFKPINPSEPIIHKKDPRLISDIDSNTDEVCVEVKGSLLKKPIEMLKEIPEINQVEQEIDVKPSASDLLAALAEVSFDASATLTPEKPVQPLVSFSKKLQSSPMQKLKVSKSICSPNSSSSSLAFSSPSTLIVTAFSTGDCKELDDAFEIRPKSVDKKVTPEEKFQPTKNEQLVNQQTDKDVSTKNNRKVVKEVLPPNIVKPELGPKETKQNKVTSKRSSRNDNTRKSSCKNRIPSNWLDISKVPVDAVLIVSATRNGYHQDGHTTLMAFRAIYDEFGQYKREIKAIVQEEGYIRIYVRNDYRSKIRKELERFNSNFRLEYKLIVDVKNPVIQFEWNQEIHRENQFEMIERLKKWNRWSGLVTWVTSKRSSSSKKFEILLAVPSKIRDTIEKENGTMFLERHQVRVIDKFNIIQCYRCSEYGHLANDCNNYRRCGFCGGGHRSDCRINDPSKWRCCLCQVHGHSAFSKHCPILIDYLRPKLGEIHHNYKYIFLDNVRDC